jgi:ferredoxin
VHREIWKDPERFIGGNRGNPLINREEEQKKEYEDFEKVLDALCACPLG